MVHYFKKAFMACFFILFFSSSWATVVLVQNTNDNGAGSLRDIITNSNPGDTVMINVKGTINLASPISIVSGITILGAFPVHSAIDCNSSLPLGGAFDVNNGAGSVVTIQGFRITNNNDGNQAILKQGNGEIRIIDCVFENNSGGAFGQCIGNFSGASGIMNIYNCSFINNTSVNPGGAIGINVSSGQTIIRNCTFFQNTANDGGAIYTDGNASIGNCTFHNNTATNSNGADIYFQSGSCEIFNNIFSGIVPADQLFRVGPNWNDLGGNVFSGNNATQYGGGGILTTLPNQFVNGQGNVGIGSLITDGYGLKYFRIVQQTSPCVDNGVTPAGGLLQTDCKRAPRTLYGDNALAPDAGAVEFTPYTVTNNLAGPGDFPSTWSAMNGISTPGPHYMDFAMGGNMTRTLPSQLFNGGSPAGEDWIVDGFTQEGSVIPGPGNTPMDVTPGVFFVNFNGTFDLCLLSNNGANSWISGLKIDNNGGTNYAFETDDANFKFFGNEIICTNGTVASNKPGILIGGISSCVVGGNRHHMRNVISGQGVALYHLGSQLWVHGNFIGTTPDGMNAIANDIGIMSSGGPIDIIGKYRYPSMNVISGNTSSQIQIDPGTFFKIKGNIIGPNYVAGASLFSTSRGIDVRSNTDGEIGGLLPGDENVIGGHTQGIHIDAANHVDMLGNFIGVSPDGTMPAIPNNDGIYIFQNGDADHVIGDGTYQGRNYISGNTQHGIYFDLTSGHLVRKNFIGLKPDNSVLGNGGHGIFVDNGSSDLVITDNVISNNTGDGINYTNAGSNDVIQNNYIGVDSLGAVAMGNLSGIVLNNVGLIGSINSNLVSGNGSTGIVVLNNSTASTLIINSNIVGLDATMSATIPNQVGISAYNGTNVGLLSNTIGGNTNDGIYFQDMTNFSIQSNFIGTNPSIATGLGNGLIGVYVEGNSSIGMIGGTSSGEENTIIQNGMGGVLVGTSSFGIGILRNEIFNNNNLGISLTTTPATPLANDTGDGDATGTAGNAGQNYPDNLVAANCSGGPSLAGDIECDQAGNYTLQVFRINPGTPDPSGHGEGNEFITEITLPFNVGNNTFSIPLPGTIVDNDILSVTSTFFNGTNYSTSEFSDTVLVKPQFTANATITNNVLCFGGSDGVITGTHGGSGPFFYSWYDNNTGLPIGQSTIAATVPAGDYYLEISTTTCTVLTNFVSVSEPSQLTVTPSSTNPVCNGNCDGTITLLESGGTAPYQYSIDNGSGFQPTNNFTALCAGAYQYLVMDANGCVTPNTGNNISLTSPPAVTLIPSVTDETCSGMNDGTITLSGSGGTPPYTYQVETSGYTTTTLYTGLASNGYNVFVMDANGCIANGFVTVNPGETVTANFSANSGCEDQPVINFTDLSSASSSTISNWNWTFPVGTLPSTTSTLTNPSAISFANSGSNNVQLDVISGNGCTASVILPVTIFQAPVADAGVDDAICEGVAFTHSASITGGTGPLTIDWQPDPGHFVDNTIEDPTILGSLSSTPGTYTHTMNVTDVNGCMSSDVMTLTIYSNPVVTAPADYSVCQGDPTTLIGSGTATTYLWDNSVTDGVSFNPSSTLSYTVIGTDVNGCQNMDMVVITVDVPFTLNAGSDFNVCENVTTINLSGTSSSGSVNWTTVNGTGTFAVANSVNGVYIPSSSDSTLNTITYTLTVPPNGACPAQSDDVIVTLQDAPIADAGTAPSSLCNNTVLNLTGNSINSSSFNWTTTGTGSLSTPTSINCDYTPGTSETGNVTIYFNVISSSLCPNTYDSLIVTMIQGPNAEAGIDNTICIGQPYTLDGSSSIGTISGYSWDEVGGANVGTNVTTIVNPSVTTDYVLTVDNGTCTDDDTITITTVSSPDASFNYSAAQYCVDAGIQSPQNVMTAGGVFSLPGFSSSINAVTGDLDPSTLPPGNYTVYYTVSTPCTAVDSASVTINGLPDATINGTLYVCVGNNQFDLNTNSSLFPVTTLTGGTWSGTGVGGNFFTPGTAGAGSHIITYSVTDANGCSNSDTASIVVNPAPVVSISGVPNPVCQTDPVFTPIGSPSGGTWLFDGNPVGSSLSIDPDTLTTVTHGISYQYTDPTTGCTATTIPPTGFTVYAVPLDPTTTQPTTQTVCSGATLSLVVSNPNGTGTSLVWYSDMALTNQIAIGPTLNTPALFNSVTYYVVVQNNGCMSNPIVFDIIVNTANVSAGPDLFICPGTPAQLNVNTSTGTISWSPGATLNDSTVQNPIATPNVNTSYVVTVTSGTCVDVDTVDVVIDGTNPDCGVVPSYNAFSPDGDGVNDNWIIDAAALHPNNHLTIFNRWGDKLVEFQDYDNVNVVWDGKYKGNLLPSGTYYYVIEYLDINIQVSGWLQITH